LHREKNGRVERGPAKGRVLSRADVKERKRGLKKKKKVSPTKSLSCHGELSARNDVPLKVLWRDREGWKTVAKEDLAKNRRRRILIHGLPGTTVKNQLSKKKNLKGQKRLRNRLRGRGNRLD